MIPLPYGATKMYDVYYHELWGKRVPLANLARGWGLPLKLLRRDFKRWCEARGLDPLDFHVRGYVFTGYWVPREFVEWWESRILPQYQRLGKAQLHFDWKAVKTKKNALKPRRVM